MARPKKETTKEGVSIKRTSGSNRAKSVEFPVIPDSKSVPTNSNHAPVKIYQADCGCIYAGKHSATSSAPIPIGYPLASCSSPFCGF